jgi:hypothetical protein
MKPRQNEKDQDKVDLGQVTALGDTPALQMSAEQIKKLRKYAEDLSAGLKAAVKQNADNHPTLSKLQEKADELKLGIDKIEPASPRMTRGGGSSGS